MLSGEGMQRRRTAKNNNRSNQQKSNFARAAHFFCTFLWSSFARLQRETSRNFFKLHFLWRKCRKCSRSLFFSLPLIFTLHWWPLAFLILSPPRQHFRVQCSSNKRMSPLFFISRSRSLSPFFSLSFAGLSLFLRLSLALQSKFFAHDN